MANISEIVQLFKGDDKPAKQEREVAVVETVDKNIEETVIEQADVIEENYAEVVEEVPPTEAQPKAVYLNNMKVAESNYDFNLKDGSGAIDTIGNTYSGYVLTAGHQNWIEEGYATYYLGGKYETLSGVIAVHDDTYGDNTGELSILCDDSIVYSTGIIGRTSIPTEFSVSVEGCQWLKFYHNKSAIKFILSNCKLEE